MELSRPQTIGPYTLLASIGKGGLSYVFLAVKDGDSFALKCLKPKRSEDPQAVASFVREVSIAMRLDHPNVLKVLDHGKSGGVYFYVTPLLLGEDLRNILNDFSSADERMPLPLGLHLIRECCRTLAHLHRTTVFENSTAVLFHGDFTPDNLVVLSDGSLRLIDFGSAGQESAADSGRRHFGKLFYLPPEILGGEAPGTQTDLYALAVLSFELLFGRRPFEADNVRLQREMILHAPIPRIDASTIVTSPKEENALRIFFQRALHKDRKMRFQTVEELERALFRVHFAQSPLADLLDVPKHLPSATLTRMSVRDAEWVRMTASARGKKLQEGLPAKKVDPIVSAAARRKHPRVSIVDSDVFVEIVDSRERVLVSGEVQELSVGGMLVRWRGRQAEKGQEYALALHLGEGKPVIRGSARVLYEVQIQARSYVGFQFTKIAPTDIRAVETMVGDRLSKEKPKRKGSSSVAAKTVVRVSFATERELREEFDRNLKHGGLFVAGRPTVRQGERVTVEIDLPGSMRRITLAGEVVFVAPPTEKKQGVALQLDGEAERIRQMLFGGS
jgi:serine/threonine protein kinase/Tfp pilus assembly protein PilZ